MYTSTWPWVPFKGNPGLAFLLAPPGSSWLLLAPPGLLLAPPGSSWALFKGNPNLESLSKGTQAQMEVYTSGLPISRWLGGWAGPLQTIFRRPPTKRWFESLRKPKEKQGLATIAAFPDGNRRREKRGGQKKQKIARPSNQKWFAGHLCKPLLK